MKKNTELIKSKELPEIYKQIKDYHYILNCVNKEKIKVLHNKALDDLVNSQSKYYFFDRDSPNFRKSNYQNKKSIVNGYFEQYNYFPWNKVSNIIFDGLKQHLNLFLDIANLYCLERTGLTYFEQTGLDLNKLFNENYFIRICYQHFPNTKGYLSIHRDPTGTHQLSAPIINLSQIKKQGLYYILNDKKINVQSKMSYGDSIYVDQSRLHAIEHDLFNERGTEHFLISVHRYHSDSKFLQSSTK